MDRTLPGLRLDDDDAHAVRHQVVQLSGDAGSFLGDRPGGLHGSFPLSSLRAAHERGGLGPPPAHPPTEEPRTGEDEPGGDDLVQGTSTVRTPTATSADPAAATRSSACAPTA